MKLLELTPWQYACYLQGHYPEHWKKTSVNVTSQSAMSVERCVILTDIVAAQVGPVLFLGTWNRNSPSWRPGPVNFYCYMYISLYNHVTLPPPSRQCYPNVTLMLP